MPSSYMKKIMFNFSSRDAAKRGKQGVTSDGHDVFDGDWLPSKSTVTWDMHGRFNEFPECTTTPQQDVKKDRSCITIQPVTDRRAQPWRALVRANVHTYKITLLPSTNATVEEVREWIYFVLTQKLYAIADCDPALITTTVQTWKADGGKLREMTAQEWADACPHVFTTVYDEQQEIIGIQRRYVSWVLTTTIRPLLKKERKLAKKTADEKERSLTPKPKWYKRIFCFGDPKVVDTKLPMSEKVEALPEYNEKAGSEDYSDTAKLIV